MVINNLRRLKYNYKNLLGSGIGLANPFVVAADKNLVGINLFLHQLSIPDYHKVMFDSQNSSSYHIAGYGQSCEETLTRALGETIERYSFMSAYHLLKNEIVSNSYNELRSKHKVLPIELINVVEDKNNYFQPIKKYAKADWLLLKNLFTQEDIYVPFCMVSAKRNGIMPVPAMSTGTATHVTRKKALINALSEAFQLDAFMNAWYGSKKLKRVNLEKNLSVEFNSIMEKTFNNKNELEIIVLENTFRESRFKNFITIIKSKNGKYPYCTVGIQGGLNYEYAVLRSIMEATAIYVTLQGFYIYEFDKINKLNFEIVNNSYNLDDTFLYWSNFEDLGMKEKKLNSIISVQQTELELTDPMSEDEELAALLNIANNELNYLFVIDISPAELQKYGFYTLRVIAPELLPMCFPALPYIYHPNFPQGDRNEFFPHPLP